MKRCNCLALLATLVTGTAMAQDVAVSTTTIVQNWKTNTPGFSTGTYTPATEYVGIDAGRLGGKDALSFHFYGWGMADLGDQSYIGGKTHRRLHVRIPASTTSARPMASSRPGRFTVNQGVGNEQVDGVSARTDLRGGFTVSASPDRPWSSTTTANNSQGQISSQRKSSPGAGSPGHAPEGGRDRRGLPSGRPFPLHPERAHRHFDRATPAGCWGWT